MHSERQRMFGIDRFGTLLFFLIFAFLISGVSDSGWPKVVGSGANVASLLAGFAATGMMAKRRRMAVLLVVGVASAVLVGFEQTSVLGATGAFGQAAVLMASCWRWSGASSPTTAWACRRSSARSLPTC